MKQLPTSVLAFLGIATGIVALIAFLAVWRFTLGLIPVYGWAVPLCVFGVIILIRETYVEVERDMKLYDENQRKRDLEKLKKKKSNDKTNS